MSIIVKHGMHHKPRVQCEKRTRLLILSFFFSLSCSGCYCYTVLTISTTKLQMHPIQHNTLKSNSVSFTGSSVEKSSILLPLIFLPSFGLSVVLGTQRKAGGWGWSRVSKTVKRLLNYSLLSVESAE